MDIFPSRSKSRFENAFMLVIGPALHALTFEVVMTLEWGRSGQECRPDV